MSSIVMGIIAVGVVVVFCLVGFKWLGKVVFLLGLGAIGVVILLLWTGRCRCTDIRDSFNEWWTGRRSGDAVQPDISSATPVAPAQPALPKRDLVRTLNALRVRRPVPSACQEAADTVANRAAPTDSRLSAVRRLVEHGASFEIDKRPLDGRQLQNQLKLN